MRLEEGSVIRVGAGCLVEGILSTYTANARITLGDNVFVGNNTLIGSACEVTIGNNVLISFDCMIQDNDNHNTDSKIRWNDTAEWKTVGDTTGQRRQCNPFESAMAPGSVQKRSS